jgi:hypothetical protein
VVDHFQLVRGANTAPTRSGAGASASTNEQQIVLAG